MASPPQQAAARKQSKHTEGRKLPGCRKANKLLPPAARCRRQPFPGPILGRPPQAPGLCLDSLLESVGGERGEADLGPCLLRPHLVPEPPRCSSGHCWEPLPDPHPWPMPHIGPQALLSWGRSMCGVRKGPWKQKITHTSVGKVFPGGPAQFSVPSADYLRSEVTVGLLVSLGGRVSSFSAADETQGYRQVRLMLAPAMKLQPSSISPNFQISKRKPREMRPLAQGCLVSKSSFHPVPKPVSLASLLMYEFPLAAETNSVTWWLGITHTCLPGSQKSITRLPTPEFG